MNEIREKDDRDTAADDAELVQLVGLKLGDEEYAIDVLKIQEIIRTVEITVVPRMDSFILGVMNLRGKVIPVIDLRVRFSLDKCDFDKSTRIIVVRFERQFIGFVVDEVTEVIRIRRSMVEPTPPLVGSIGQEYILGICKYDARLIMLLDIDRVLNESGEYIESELRRKMLGSSNKNAPSAPVRPVAVSPKESEASEKRPAGIQSVAPAEEPAKELPDPDGVPAPVIMTVEENSSIDISAEESIDALIAKELAKREAETEELNKKKRRRPEDSSEAILADALAQSSAIFKCGEEQHVAQDDLDSLIARELAKREAETDELNKKRRTEKKNDVEEAETVCDAVSSDGSPDESQAARSSDVLSSAAGAGAESIRVSIKELKRIADKIIAGENPDGLDINIKGEIGELLRLIIDTKSKVDEINPFLQSSQEAIPAVTSVLEDVNHTTEKATINLMEASDRMSSFYKDFIEDIRTLKTISSKEHEAEFFELYEKTCGNLSQAEELGFKILEALEFQDITEQKLRKVIKSIEDMGARIGTIVGFLQVKQPKNGDKRADKLLMDYGLA